MVPSVQRIVDAGPLVAWHNGCDRYHPWSRDTIQAEHGVLHTTEIALGEACHLLGKTSPAVHRLLDLVRGGALVLHPVWPARLGRCQELMLKYEFMDPADASLVALSELHPAAMVITVDQHFRVYRRFRHEALPLVMPPA